MQFLDIEAREEPESPRVRHRRKRRRTGEQKEAHRVSEQRRRQNRDKENADIHRDRHRVEQRRHRSQLSPAQVLQELDLNRQQQQLLRSQLSPVQVSQQRELNRQQHHRRRRAQSPVEAADERAANNEQHKRRREREAEKEKRRAKKQRREESLPKLALTYKETDITEHSTGEMSHRCQYCNALHFSAENLSSSCCHHGKVELPSFEPLPSLLHGLLFGSDSLLQLQPQQQDYHGTPSAQ